MKLLKYIGFYIVSSVVMLSLTACHETPEYPNDYYGNFDALSNIFSERYCFFNEKSINWEELCAQYRAKITPETKYLEFFEICSDLLSELKDGHVNLSSSFTTSYYREWWSNYPQDFNLRTLQQYYLGFDYYQTSGILYKILDENIGYMYYPSFSSPIGQTNLDYILAILSNTDGLIIDIRNNGGGMLTNIETLVSRFIDNKTLGGYIRHKTGPGINDFSEPYPIEYDPAPEGRIKYKGKIIILTNRSCYSAANDFVAVMKSLPGVKIVGAKTGGGGGLPFSSELPNGWAVRFSACPINDPDDKQTEFGIDPSPGCEVHASDEGLAAGKDAILDFALELLCKKEI